MFGGAEEEDADFLSPTGGTRLASLFGLDQTVTETGNDFFQYTPPKQPKKGQTPNAAGTPSQKPPVPASGVPSVFIATAVHAYRFVNGQYVKQGKYGAAVVGSHTTKEYRILLYINQQQQIAVARIHWGFVFTVQLNNYSTFYDDQRQNWSIMFESEKTTMDFSKQLCIAKYNSNPSPDAVLYQDLTIGDGQGVEVGDALEVAFTGWLFQNGSLGQVFDSNVNKDKFLRLKLGSGKVIKGWEEGMIGLKKGARRFLIIPPALAYGSQGIANRIPPDSTLAFEVEVKRVRLVKDSTTNGQSLGPRDSLAPSPAPTPENLAVEPSGLVPAAQPPKLGEPAVRVKSNSVSEQLANPDLAKAKLISRMAKMGQPMLPFLSTTSASQLDSSDSEIEDPSIMRGAAQPPATPPLKPSPQTTLPQMTGQASQPAISGLHGPSAAVIPAVLQPHATLPGTTQSFQPFPGVTYGYPQASAATSQLQPVGAVYPAPFQAAGDIGSFLMTEARQQNTEIRLAVGKVADKMDQLVAKVEELQKQNSSHSLLPGISSVTMETSMIMSNIQRIIQENERLKQEVFEKSSRIEELNEKISELIDRNQRYVEQSNLLMERRNNSLQMTTEHTQARVLHAEQEKVKVAEELAATTAQISRLQLELTDHQKKEMELRSQLNAAAKEAERHSGQLSQLQAQLAELQESSDDARNKFQLERQSRKQLDGKVSVLEEELADLRTEKENLEKSLSERKKKSLLERKQAEDEMEEIRRSYQEELDKLRQLLKKARTSTDQAASEQLSLMQAELESQWEAKSERLLASAKEQHARQYQDVCEQRDAQQQQISQLEEKLSLLKNVKSSEEERVSALQEQLEQLEPVKEKYLALQSQMAVLKAQHEEQIQELKKVVDRPSPARAPEEVKKIMNGVFQALRGQFDLEEFYTGRTVLGIVMNTIKTTTLKLLEQQKEREESVETEEEDLAATEGSQTSPETHSQERQTDSAPPEPPPSASTVAASIPSTNLEKESCASPSASEEEGQTQLASVASEALTSKACDDKIPSTLSQSVESLQGPEIAQLSGREEEEEEEEEEESNTQDETKPVGAAASGLKPAADEASLEVQEIPIEAGKEDKPGPDLPSQHSSDFTPPASAVGKQDVAQQEPAPSPVQKDCSSLEDEDGLFKVATLKPSTPRGQVEDEEEEELSFKGRPPPTPLFGDDDDDDDLDWLG